MGFGEQMKRARVLRGLTQRQVVGRLAELSYSLTCAGLSKYERGGSTPRANLLVLLAQVYRVPADYFLESSASLAIEWRAYRKQSKVPARQLNAIRARAEEQAIGFVELHRAMYPGEAPSFPDPVTVTDGESAESAARYLREQWALPPRSVDSLAELVEEKGGIVVEAKVEGARLDGVSGWADGCYPLVVVSDETTDDRRRFNLAHELGHLIMRCPDVDQRTEERLAHRFASAFIVPRELALRELGDKRRIVLDRELMLLKLKHGLSMQAWLFRARDLGIVSESQFRSAWMRFSARGWRRQEPVEFKGQERPVRLKQMLLRALAEKIIAPDRAERLLPGITRAAFGEDEGLPVDYVDSRDVIRLPGAERERILSRAAEGARAYYETLEDAES